MSDKSVPRNDSLVPRLQMELKSLIISLREELEGKTAKSPQAWKLLHDATALVRHSQAALTLAAAEIERLQAELARRKPPDDDGLPETVLVEPPNRPRGGSPASATRPEDGTESARDAEDFMVPVAEIDTTTGDSRRRATTH
jgi:hypothetical protein